MSKPVIVLGAGGHAKVLVDILRQLGTEIIGIVAKNAPQDNPVFANLPYFSSDDHVLDFNSSEVQLVNGIGSLPGRNGRFELQQAFEEKGYEFLTVVSPRAIVSEYIKLGDGVQVMPGAIINANTRIGKGTIVNSGAVVEHDVVVGANNHIAPGATICGMVKIGEFVHIGAGAVVIEGIDIGSNAIIGAGAFVTGCISSNSTVYPAKVYIKHGESRYGE